MTAPTTESLSISGVARESTSPPEQIVAARPSTRFVVGCALLVAFAYVWTLGNGFVQWDDHDNIIANPYLRAITPETLRWMFTTFQGGPYQPLSWFTLALDYRLWGLNPVGFHATNVVLHTVGAVAFAIVVWKLYWFALASQAPGVSALATATMTTALFYAVHPLRVESVAWATERRDVLSGAFLFAALVAYLSAVARRAEPRARLGYLALSVLCFLAASLSKGTVVPLPVALLVLDWYPLRRYGWGDGEGFQKVLLEKIPFFLVSLVFGALAVHGQSVEGNLAPAGGFAIGQRLMAACFGVAFYLAKTLVPLGLSPLYEMPAQWQRWHYAYAGVGIVLVLGTVVLWKKRRRWPAVVAAWLCYLAFLAPVSGILQAGPQIAADRYSYLCGAALSTFAGGALLGLGLQRFLPEWRLGAGTMYVVLYLLTWRQISFWNNDRALWERAVQLDPDCSLGLTYLADEYFRAGNLDRAESHARRALARRPNNAEARNVLGNVLSGRNQLEEAERQYREALKIRPGQPVYRLNLAGVLREQGRIQEAEKEILEVIRQQPDYVHAYNNLALLRKHQKRYQEAVEIFEQVLARDPDYPLALFNLARLRWEMGEKQEAEKLFRRALAIRPDDGATAANLAQLLQEQGRWAEAQQILQVVYDRMRGASRGLMAREDLFLVRYHLALLLAAAPLEDLRDGPRAEQHARWLMDQSQKADPRAYDALAAALAEQGQFDRAAQVAEQGLQLARRFGFHDLAAQLEARLKLYQSSKTLRLGL
jgi:Flp pilus assembly protein TadD